MVVYAVLVMVVVVIVVVVVLLLLNTSITTNTPQITTICAVGSCGGVTRARVGAREKKPCLCPWEEIPLQLKKNPLPTMAVRHGPTIG